MEGQVLLYNQTVKSDVFLPLLGLKGIFFDRRSTQINEKKLLNAVLLITPSSDDSLLLIFS